jgi:RND family efflux transporter MFP subunit
MFAFRMYLRRAGSLLPLPGARSPALLAAASVVLFSAAMAFAPAFAADAAVLPAAMHIVAYREVTEVISAEGVVEAVRQSTLAAQIAGQVVQVEVRVGDSVKAGQVLLRIDPRSAEQAVSGSRSQVAEAQAGLNNALRSFERSKQLFEQKFISKAALDLAELDVKAAQARVAALQANAGQAMTARTFATITAPFAGIIAETPVQIGDMATPGRPLISLFDPANMRVIATLSQSSLRDVKLKQAAQIEIPPSGKRIPSKQITLIPLADSRSHTVKLRLELGSTSDLLPGQFVRAFFVTGSGRKLMVPQGAVLRRSEVTAAYVLDSAGQAQLRQIRTGDRTGDGFVEVLAGLHEGERVAADGVQAGLSVGKGNDGSTAGARK